MDAIKQLLPQFRAIIPPSVTMQTLYDRRHLDSRLGERREIHAFPRRSLLVVMVIFLFLRNLSATVIPSIALPMSIVGTFAVMYELNYTIDNLSLMALTLSVGFVVDDAIVMLENIVRHMEMGEGVMEAALNGSREIGFTILSMTLSLAAVFIPVLFHGRHHRAAAARIFRRDHGGDSGFRICFAHADADAVQPLSAPAAETRSTGAFTWRWSDFSTGCCSDYDVSLQWALRHRVFVMAVSGVILVDHRAGNFA